MTKLDIYNVVAMAEKAWKQGVTKARIENCWRHYRLGPYMENFPQSEQRDIDLNATFKDFDLNEEVHAMEEKINDL